MSRYYISILVGVSLGLFMCYIAWQHNSQQEIVSEASVDYGYLALLFIFWMIIGFIVSLVIAFLINRVKSN